MKNTARLNDKNHQQDDAPPQRTAQTASSQGQTRAEHTREKLILAAEELMGTHGIEAVALREIAMKAGQRNSNVIQYHFTDRLGLLDALFEYRAHQIGPVRRQMLAEARNRGQLDDVKTLLRCAMEPEFTPYREEGSLHYVRVMIHYMLYLRPRGISHPYDRQSPATSSLREVLDLLHQRLAHLPADRFEFRVSMVDTLLYSALLTISQRGHDKDEGEGETVAILMEDALEMMVAALCAPPWKASPHPAGH